MNAAQRAKEWRQKHPDSNRRRRERNPIESILSTLKGKAKRLGLEFNLTEEWYLAHFSQGCAVTGAELAAPSIGTGSGHRPPNGPQVDRIKIGGNYTMDNCRIVCAIYNQARSNWSDEDVMRMARELCR
jgi:hypothetical protein